MKKIRVKTSLSKPTLKNIKKISSSHTSFGYENDLKHQTMHEIFNNKDISEVMKRLSKV